MSGTDEANPGAAKAARGAAGFDACDIEQMNAAAMAALPTLKTMLPELLDGLTAGADNQNPENQAYLRGRFREQLTPEREAAINQSVRLAMESARARCIDGQRSHSKRERPPLTS